jgi:RNA polymerase subunit RPABC4/transcription elongation factor Spt4
VDLGLEPFMVATSLIGVVSTRLVRTLCPKCREAYEVNASNLGRLGASESVEGTVVLHRGRGCPVCLQTGYHGRVGTFEVLEVTDTVRSLINQRAPDSAIRHAAIETGMRSIGEDGLRKVLDGLTTLEEVTRVVYLSEQAPKTCPTCRTVLAQDFEYCTSCGGFVGDHCEGCRRPLSAEWAFCPHCGSTTSGLARARASRSASRRQTTTIDQGLERVPSRARRAS